MWRLWLVLGAVVWLATVVASGAVNYFAGADLGRTPVEAQVFGVLGVAADGWKSLGPIFTLALWRDGRKLGALIGLAVWISSFAFAVNSAVGLAALNRGSLAGGREAQHVQFDVIQQELKSLTDRRAALQGQRSGREVEAAIAVSIARPVAGRGTVGSISDGCTKDTPRTREECAAVAALRQELTRSVEAERVDQRITLLQRDANVLRQRGAGRDADLHGRLMSRLSFGLVGVGDVGLAMVLMFACMIELISAFGPAILSEFAATKRKPGSVVAETLTSLPVATGRGQSRFDAAQRERSQVTDIALRPLGGVFAYLADRVRPADGHVSQNILLGDYRVWCDRSDFEAMTASAFVEELNQIIRDDLSGRVQREGERYIGIGLNDGQLQLPAREE